MKIVICILLFIFGTFSLFADNFSDLRGIEYPDEGTTLFYRRHWTEQPVPYRTYHYHSIFKLSINNLTETLYFEDYEYSYDFDMYYYNITDYQITINDGYLLKTIFYPDTHYTQFWKHSNLSNPIFQFLYFYSNNHLSISIQDENIAYVSGPLKKSYNGGLSWVLLPTTYNIWNASPFNDSLVFANWSINLYKSVDGAETFNIVNSPDEILWYSTSTWNETDYLKLIFDCDSTHIYAVVLGENWQENIHYIVKSNDMGDNWEILQTFNVTPYLSIDNSCSGKLYLAYGSSIYESNDYGSIFIEIYTLDEPIRGIYKKPYSEIIYALTAQNIYEISPDYTNIILQYTDLQENTIHKISEIYNLSNFPNPFNPSTTIEFSISNDSDVELSIYNMKGQKINTLTHNEYPKGSHSIVWNGEDTSWKKVGSGVYFYKLMVNGKIEAVKKCLLLK